jgi:hypothetical protein
MQCRTCGTEIADKALICYRCGAATIDPVHKPPADRGRSRSRAIAIVAAVIAALLAALVFLLMLR